jgi:exportin-2 (importin alpha re-exporter)
MLSEYMSDNSGKWKAKNAAVYLVTSMTGKGQTQKHGVTQISALVPFSEFATQHILPELTKDGEDIIFGSIIFYSHFGVLYYCIK